LKEGGLELRPVRIASRGSMLALIQTNWVIDRLKESNPGSEFSVDIYKTVGDRVLDVALSQIGGKGLFTKELEEAMLQDKADLAVHSLKDMPTEQPDGLVIGAIPKREDPRDVLITVDGTRFMDMAPGTLVGTSSLRRVAQLRAHRPDLDFAPVRGNIDTRLRKLREGQVGALVMAASGMIRAGFGDQITEFLDPDFCLPAPGQGALAIQIRATDSGLDQLISTIHHPESALDILAERTLLARLQGGCQVPIGAYAAQDRGQLRLRGAIASPDGTQVIHHEATGPIAQAKALGEQVADWLMANGGSEILKALRA
jgi:hydroxymethylbilane synthase